MLGGGPKPGERHPPLRMLDPGMERSTPGDGSLSRLRTNLCSLAIDELTRPPHLKSESTLNQALGVSKRESLQGRSVCP